MESRLIQFNKPLFLIDPGLAFGKKRNVSIKLLEELYDRRFNHKEQVEYCQEYFEIKSKGKKIDRKNLTLWLNRMEVYKRAQHAIGEAGSNWLLLKVDPIQYFGVLGEFVLKELNKRGNK